MLQLEASRPRAGMVRGRQGYGTGVRSDRGAEKSSQISNALAVVVGPLKTPARRVLVVNNPHQLSHCQRSKTRGECQIGLVRSACGSSTPMVILRMRQRLMQAKVNDLRAFGTHTTGGFPARSLLATACRSLAWSDGCRLPGLKLKQCSTRQRVPEVSLCEVHGQAAGCNAARLRV